MHHTLFLGGFEDLRWCRETTFGSGVAKALIWRIATSGGGMCTELDYQGLSAEHEFTVHEIRTAVAHLVVHGFARVVHGFEGVAGDVLVLLTPGRLAADAREAADAEAVAAERAAKIARAGGREYRAPIPAQVRAAVFARDGHACLECGATEDLTLDHEHPWSRGGPDTVENLRVLCRSCNSRKRDRV